jgi:hypothetical protein
LSRKNGMIVAPLVIGLLMVALVLMVVRVEAVEGSTDSIEINGLFWGDGDYLEYNFKSETEPAALGSLYLKNGVSGQIRALVRVGWMANDNAFSPIKPNQDAYLSSVDWQNPHDLGRLIGSDHLEMYVECGQGDSARRWAWIQDLLYDADEGPGYDWRSDSGGPDGVPVNSPTGDSIPPSGIIITSHSSLEYNLENSSWISNQQALYPNNLEQWMSPDLAPLGTISVTTPMTDINALTGVYEDYPFYVSTGSDSGDLYEWEISYEMLLDVSHCSGEPLFIGVSSAHNSPPKAGSEDLVIPTAIRLTSLSAKSGGGDLAPRLVVTATLLLASATALLILLRKSGATMDEPL